MDRKQSFGTRQNKTVQICRKTIPYYPPRIFYLREILKQGGVPCKFRSFLFEVHHLHRHFHSYPFVSVASHSTASNSLETIQHCTFANHNCQEKHLRKNRILQPTRKTLMQYQPKKIARHFLRNCRSHIETHRINRSGVRTGASSSNEWRLPAVCQTIINTSQAAAAGAVNPHRRIGQSHSCGDIDSLSITGIRESRTG